MVFGEIVLPGPLATAEAPIAAGTKSQSRGAGIEAGIVAIIPRKSHGCNGIGIGMQCGNRVVGTTRIDRLKLAAAVGQTKSISTRTPLDFTTVIAIALLHIIHADIWGRGAIAAFTSGEYVTATIIVEIINPEPGVDRIV